LFYGINIMAAPGAGRKPPSVKGRNLRFLPLAAFYCAPYPRAVRATDPAAWACSGGRGRFNKSSGDLRIKSIIALPAGCVVSVPLTGALAPAACATPRPGVRGDFPQQGAKLPTVSRPPAPGALLDI